MYDFIGDIHGHADELEVLLAKLGYDKHGEAYTHPERTAFFVGDYIDRGPKIVETLRIVKAMVDAGSALALAGNHEYNALCFHFPETAGGHIRPHLIKNIIQHYETLKQFQNRQHEYEEYMEWFKTLPLYYEADTFRAVHACWDDESIAYLRETLPDAKLTDKLIYESAKKHSPLHKAVEVTLKGKEVALPAGMSFNDKDGTARSELRIKWWEDASSNSIHQLSVKPQDTFPHIKLDTELAQTLLHYREDQKPVFFGHYWLEGLPALYRGNICCLDYSVAKKGNLVAYRFDDEQELDPKKFVYV